mmetsp:Transcript_17413/g.12419  ORF Transcript_17413/g.12419 Transcript_17413/m.12419 type:complete len:103 (+) Transcript_17413:1420-1728(+)
MNGGSTNKKVRMSSGKDTTSTKKTAVTTASHQDTITPDKMSSLPRNKLVGMVNKTHGSTGEKGSIPTAVKRSCSGIANMSQLPHKSSTKKTDNTSSKKKSQH